MYRYIHTHNHIYILNKEIDHALGNVIMWLFSRSSGMNETQCKFPICTAYLNFSLPLIVQHTHSGYGRGLLLCSRFRYLFFYSKA